VPRSLQHAFRGRDHREGSHLRRTNWSPVAATQASQLQLLHHVLHRPRWSAAWSCNLWWITLFGVVEFAADFSICRIDFAPSSDVKASAEKEKVFDYGDRPPGRTKSRAKQAIAGTAGVGGQRSGCPKLMSSKAQRQVGLRSPPVTSAHRARESSHSEVSDPCEARVGQ
jgi:hypothetical protein